MLDPINCFSDKPWKMVWIYIAIFRESSWTMVVIICQYPPSLTKNRERSRLNWLRPPQGVHRAHLHQAYKPCFITAVPPQTYWIVCWWSHRFVLTLLKWYKVKRLQRWTSWTPRGGLKVGIGHLKLCCLSTHYISIMYLCGMYRSGPQMYKSTDSQGPVMEGIIHLTRVPAWADQSQPWAHDLLSSVLATF